MQNSKKLEKSKGIVVFAFNTSFVDYVGIADFTSRLSHKFLNLPITLITDNTATPKFNYDKIIRLDYSGDNFRLNSKEGVSAEWKNFGRYLAYELSPYEDTILLDGDYLTLDDSLLKLWQQPFDYKLMYQSITPEEYMHNKMSVNGLDFVWATVVLFRKSDKAKMLFDTVGRIQRNYPYYKTLYNGDGSYRNDYAFAIADMLLNGYKITRKQGIPWRMLTIDNNISDIKIKDNNLIIREAEKAIVSPWQNLHVMDKKFLMSDNFKKFVEEVEHNVSH